MQSLKIVKGILIAGLGLLGGTGIKLGWDEWHYGPDGYNGNGRDKNGFDRDGFDPSGYDHDGYDRTGRDKRGYDRDGYDKDGYDIRRRDREGYDKRGYDRDGFDRDGYDSQGYGRDGFNSSGVDRAKSTRRHYDFEVDNMNEQLRKAWSEKGKHEYENAVTPARIAMECGVHNVLYHWYGRPDHLPVMQQQIERCSEHLGEDMCSKLEGVWKITSRSMHYDDGMSKPLTDQQVHFCLKTLEELRDVLALYGTRID